MASEPKNFSLQELTALLEHKKTVVLYKGAKWMDWESAAFLTGEPHVVAINPDEDWPLQVSFSGSVSDAQPVPYDPEMQFVVR